LAEAVDDLDPDADRSRLRCGLAEAPYRLTAALAAS